MTFNTRDYSKNCHIEEIGKVEHDQVEIFEE